MAQCTDPRLRRSVIYELYVRSHTPQGTFRAVVPDLDRIAALGVDIIWLMPIHPIGVKNKKALSAAPMPTVTTAPSTRNTARWRTFCSSWRRSTAGA